METASQTTRRAKDQQRRKDGGFGGPYIGRVFSVNPLTERTNVDFYAGAKSGKGIKVVHPFLSMSSWHRVMPDEGSGVLLINRVDTRDAEIQSYFQPNTETRIEAYTNAVEAYRPLQPGEQELSSKGLAQIFMARRAIMDQRAGVIRSWHNQDKTEYGTKAPTHRRVGYQNASDIIGDEERWGVVKRPTSSIYEQYVKVDDKYAKEHINVMLFEGEPNVLFDKREGHVVSNTGEQIASDLTGELLRLRHIFYNTDGEGFISEIDELGNAAIILPSKAENGLALLIPGGGLQVQIAKDFTRTIDGSESASVATDKTSLVEGKETVQVDGETTHSFAGNLKVTVTSSKTTWEDAAGNKMVWASGGFYFQDSKGNKISLANLIWHSHMGNMGAPVSPMNATPTSDGTFPVTPVTIP